MADDGDKQQREAARRVLEAIGDIERLEEKASPCDKVERAFSALALSELERRLIQVLLDNPGATSSALTRAMNWDDKAWQLHFGRIGWERQEYLWPAPWAEARGAPFKAGILADYDRETSGFTMKPEVAEGLKRLGITARKAEPHAQSRREGKAPRRT